MPVSAAQATYLDTCIVQLATKRVMQAVSLTCTCEAQQGSVISLSDPTATIIDSQSNNCITLA